MYAGKTCNDKVHDIATAILPRVLDEMGVPCTIKTGENSFQFNTPEIVKIYNELFKAIDYEKYGQYMEEQE